MAAREHDGILWLGHARDAEPLVLPVANALEAEHLGHLDEAIGRPQEQLLDCAQVTAAAQDSAVWRDLGGSAPRSAPRSGTDSGIGVLGVGDGM